MQFNQPSSRSPVFDFDDVWADHVLALRTTVKADDWLQHLPMEGVASTSWHAVKADDQYYPNTTHWTTMAPVAHPPPPAPHHHLPMSDLDSWAAMMYPTTSTFEGYMMPIDQTSSTTSISTFASSSCGSKRPSPSSFSDDEEDRPLEIKAKRPRLDLPSPPPTDDQSYYETLQGPWTLPNIPPPPLPTRRATTTSSPTFVSVRPMPPLRIPVPRLPQQIWSAAAALGSD